MARREGRGSAYQFSEAEAILRLFLERSELVGVLRQRLGDVPPTGVVHYL